MYLVYCSLDDELEQQECEKEMSDDSFLYSEVLFLDSKQRNYSYRIQMSLLWVSQE